MINQSDPSTIPAPENNFLRWPTWNYTNYYDIYCTNGTTVPGQKNYLVGTIYIIEYLVYISLYVPSLIVIRRSHLFEHACYKLMLCIGILDCYGLTFYALLAGIFSIMGANYCDNNFIIILSAHIVHGFWGMFCCSVVVLALNRCIDIYSRNAADVLFGGKRVWLWAIPVLIYGALFSSDYDIPPVYNSVWSCYLFNIDYRPGAPPVYNRFCFMNSCWVMAALIILYSLLLRKLWKSKGIVGDSALQSMQKKVLIQSFVICFSVFLVAFTSASAMFIRIPNELAISATVTLQVCSGTTAVVYLTLNKTIRNGVIDLLGFDKRYRSETTPMHFDSKMLNNSATKNNAVMPLSNEKFK